MTDACTRWFAAIVWVWMAGSASHVAADSLSQPSPPLFSNTRAFTLPFSVASPQPGKSSPIEVQLHVSDDGGRSWRMAARVPPSVGEFQFETVRDGEYAFMVRTMDAAYHLQPDGPAIPQMRVVIDTERPQLKLMASQGAAGELRGAWSVNEANLNEESFRVEYQLDGSPARQVAVERLGRISNSLDYFGEARWMPEVRGQGYVVRAQVSDLAGNVATAEIRVSAGELAEADGWRPRVAENAAPRPAVMNQSDVASGPALGGGPSLFGTPDATPPSPTVAELPFGGAPTPGQANAAGAPAANELWTPPSPYQLPDQRATNSSIYASERPVLRAGPPASAGGEEIPLGDQYTAGQMGAGAPLESSTGEARTYLGEYLPPGETPRLVNSRRFQLEYEVQSLGSSGISKVVLWGSRDGGRSWASYGADDDNLSPLIVSVDQEGLYGFRIVVETASGLSGKPPRPGDLPDIWVGVDLTKPTARFISAEQGTGDEAGELDIRWEAADQQLAARPVSLYFSETPSGPWTPVASGLENRGTFKWRLDPRVPDFFYLRLEVRDEAGNLQEIRTGNAVNIERVHPEGHIRDVRPVVGSASARRITNLR